MSVSERADSSAGVRLGCALIIDLVGPKSGRTARRDSTIQQLRELVEQSPEFIRAKQSKDAKLSLRENGIVVAFLSGVEPAVTCALQLLQEAKGQEFILAAALDFGPIELPRRAGNQPFITGEAVGEAVHILSSANPGELVITKRARDLLGTYKLPGNLAFIESGTAHSHGGPAIYRVADTSKSTKDVPYARFFAQAKYLRETAQHKGKTAVATTERIAKRLYDLRRSLIIGSIFFGVGLLVHVWAEQADIFHHRLQLLAYEALTSQLDQPLSEAPVKVVDIGQDFSMEKYPSYTDFDALGLLLDEMTKDPATRPRAIAVDIDFGVDPLDSDKPEYAEKRSRFIQQARQLTTERCPVYLAVSRTLPLGPSDWLDGVENAELVVSAQRPLDGPDGQIDMVDDLEFQRQGMSFPVNTKVYSIATRMAQAFHDHTPPKPWFATEYTEEVHEEGKLPLKRYFLNLSALEEIKDGKVSANEIVGKIDGKWTRMPSATGQLKKIFDRAVIIGTTTDHSDWWKTPITKDGEPAVYAHALAADTKIRAPLYGLSGSMGVVLTCLFGIALLAVVLGVRRLYITEPDEVDTQRVSTFALWLMVVITLGVGVAFVRVYRTLWLDFFLVALLLVVHPKIEHWVMKLVKGSRNMIAKGVRSLVLTSGDKSS